jgi:hypothetical protein
MSQQDGQHPSQAFLRQPLTANYKPRVFGWFLDYNDPRPWFRLHDVERMRRDPKIRLGLRVLRAPVRRAKWEVRSADSQVAAFVDQMLKRIWKRCLGRVLKMLEYGWCAGEWTYCTENGQLVVDDLLDTYPLDADPLEIENKIVGCQVKGSGGVIRLGSPRFLWLVNEPEYDRYRGLSRLSNAWTPWMEKTGRHGALEARRLWFIKNAYLGTTIYYPLGNTEVDDGAGGIRVMDNQDLAREIAEKLETGGLPALPSTRDEHGQRMWELDPPRINGNATEMREYPKDLDKEILEGMGIPPEVIQTTGDPGSGYAGRSIPAAAFYASEDDIVATVVDGVDRSAIFPLVRANFHHTKYEIEVKSLLDSETPPQGEVPGELDDDLPAPGLLLPSLKPTPNQPNNRAPMPGAELRMSLAETVAAEARRRFPIVSVQMPGEAPETIDLE